MEPEFTRKVFNNVDRKYVKSYNIERDGNDLIYYIYLTLITQTGLGKILMFLSKSNGIMRMYPYTNLICVEIKIKQQKE